MTGAARALADRRPMPTDREAGGGVRAPSSTARTGGRRSDVEVVLDVSRLLSRSNFSAPTGVDRVEMAYARRLLALMPERLGFVAVHPLGFSGRLRTQAVVDFLERTASAWRGDTQAAGARARQAAAIQAHIRPWSQRKHEPPADRKPERVYLLVSHHHLERPRIVRNILVRERARMVCLVHDLIPIEYPEYARPNGLAAHARRMKTIADLADGVICGSEASHDSFLKHMRGGAGKIRVKTASLGADPMAIPAVSPPDAGAYFVSIGTIEPRKNHLLLLNLWRRLVDRLGPAAPRLILVGRRGWENENIVDMLDRCPALKGVVEERGQVPDAEMHALVRGARALLMPSFTEGFGLPVIEALQIGTPVLCSDIAAHREIAGGVGEFLDPLDGPAWWRAIVDYADPASDRRQQQVRRLSAWRAPTWETHVDAALDLIEEIVG